MKALEKTDDRQEDTLNIREKFQQREQNFLSDYGTPSAGARRRQPEINPCGIRTPFQLDRDRIVYSNAFRRLKYKTQVFLSPLGDHYRTRLTHTLEVSETARNITRAMRLNEDLAEAIALGHDLGHTPFGHGGETALIEAHSAHFAHSDQSLRVVDILENRGQGLNLTREVRDGILKHSKGFGNIIPATPGGILARRMRAANPEKDPKLRLRVVERGGVPIGKMIMGNTNPAKSANCFRPDCGVSASGGKRCAVSGVTYRYVCQKESTVGGNDNGTAPETF